MEELICPKCHLAVRVSDYYCSNCGTSIHPKPPSVSLESQLLLYIGSFLVPPMGFIWGFRYIREIDTKSKTVGYAAMAITVIAILVYTVWIVNTMNSVNKQINQLQNLQGF